MRRLGPVRLRNPWPRLAACGRGLRDESGNALIELAMIFVFLGIPMLWGTAQMGIIIYDSIEVSNAANAGAIFGAQYAGNAGTPLAIKAAAQAEAPDFPSTSLGNSALTVTSSPFYYCANAIGGTNPQLASSSTCGAAGTVNESVEFIQVQTQGTVTPILKFPGVPSSYTVKGSAVLAVQQ